MFRRTNLLMSVALLVGGALNPSAFAHEKIRPDNDMNQPEDFRRQAPAPLPSKPLNIPTPFETRLPNGLQLAIVESKRLPLVAYGSHFARARSRPAGPSWSLRMLHGHVDGRPETRTSRQSPTMRRASGRCYRQARTQNTRRVAAPPLRVRRSVLDLMADILCARHSPRTSFS